MAQDSKPQRITVTRDGPYMVTGSVPLREQSIVTDAEGGSVDWQVTGEFEDKKTYALCRCGQSANKPYCDGSHSRVGFDGTETAGNAPYVDEAKLYRGPAMSLTDNERLCAFARFCDPNGQVWRQVEGTDQPAVARQFTRQVNRCSSGRLIAWDNASGEAQEQQRPAQISTTQDTARGVSGPLWVEGGIEVVSADGTRYEQRNRVTLCRCGESRNKPFCDGTHAAIGFSDK